MRTRQILSALAATLLLRRLSPRTVAGQRGSSCTSTAGYAGCFVSPLDAVFKSLQTSTQGQPVHIPFKPIALVVAGVILMSVAVKHWNRRKANPKPLTNHRKLLVEASRAAGVSKTRLRRIGPLAAADGLSSPLVAMICPSAIKRLAAVVKTADEQEALKSIAQILLRSQADSMTATTKTK